MRVKLQVIEMEAEKTGQMLAEARRILEKSDGLNVLPRIEALRNALMASRANVDRIVKSGIGLYSSLNEREFTETNHKVAAEKLQAKISTDYVGMDEIYTSAKGYMSIEGGESKRKTTAEPTLQTTSPGRGSQQ